MINCPYKSDSALAYPIGYRSNEQRGSVRRTCATFVFILRGVATPEEEGRKRERDREKNEI